MSSAILATSTSGYFEQKCDENVELMGDEQQSTP